MSAVTRCCYKSLVVRNGRWLTNSCLIGCAANLAKRPRPTSSPCPRPVSARSCPHAFDRHTHAVAVNTCLTCCLGGLASGVDPCSFHENGFACAGACRCPGGLSSLCLHQPFRSDRHLDSCARNPNHLSGGSLCHPDCVGGRGHALSSSPWCLCPRAQSAVSRCVGSAPIGHTGREGGGGLEDLGLSGGARGRGEVWGRPGCLCGRRHPGIGGDGLLDYCA